MASTLAGTTIVITRPAGTGAPLVRGVRALRGTPLLLPGSSLRAPVNEDAARGALRDALAGDVAIFVSPAAVRWARRLASLRGPAHVLAPGAGTLRALRRAGVTHARAPAREDSEGILSLPALQRVRGQRIGIVGAAGGRGLLERELAARGARVGKAHVYRRLPARLDRRHADALRRCAGQPLYVLVTSAQALANILAALPDDAARVLRSGHAVVSSERLAAKARAAGFRGLVRARSAHAGDLLAAVAAARSRRGSLLA